MSFRTSHSCPETAELTSQILRTIESWTCEQNKDTQFLEFGSVLLAAEHLAELCWADARNLEDAG